MRELLEVSSKSNAQFIPSGLLLGDFPWDAPLWTAGKNVVFNEGKVKKAMGWKNQVTAGTTTIKAVAQAKTDTEQRAYFGNATQLYSWNGTTATLIGSGFTADDWVLEPWGNWLIATNGTDQVQVWKNTGSAANLAGTTFTKAQLLAKRGPYILALNTSNGGTWVEWCSDDDIEDWTPTAVNTAGNFTIRDLDSDIIACASIGEAISVYSKESMSVIDYAPDARFVFSVNPALRGVGAVSKRCVVSKGRLNYGISRGAIWETDGSSVRYIDDPAEVQQNIRGWVQDNINWTAATTIRGFHDIVQSMIVWAVPTGTATQPNACIGYNYSNNSWTYLDFAFDAVAEREVFDYPLMAFSNTLAFGSNGIDADTAALPCYIQTAPLDCANREILKRLQLVRLNIVKAGSVTLQIGFQDKLDDAITWLDATTAELQNDMQDREGVFISLKLSANDVGADFALSGFKLLGEPAGAVA